MTDEAIAFYAHKFFPHLTPECGKNVVIAILANRRK